MDRVDWNAELVRGDGCAPSSWTPEESQVESYEHQDNANVYCQPFPESVSEERDIHSDDDGYHCQHVNRDSDLPAQLTSHGLYSNKGMSVRKIDRVSLRTRQMAQADGGERWLVQGVQQPQ